MRIRTDYVGMHKRRAVPFAAILRGTLKRGVTRNWIGTVNFFKMKIREARNQPRNAASGSLHFYRDRDRVAVILYGEDHRQLVESRRVHRLPELALAGVAVAERNVGHRIAVQRDISELTLCLPVL